MRVRDLADFIGLDTVISGRRMIFRTFITSASWHETEQVFEKRENRFLHIPEVLPSAINGRLWLESRFWQATQRRVYEFSPKPVYRSQAACFVP
jgi:hypothetical protein